MIRASCVEGANPCNDTMTVMAGGEWLPVLGAIAVVATIVALAVLVARSRR